MCRVILCKYRHFLPIVQIKKEQSSMNVAYLLFFVSILFFIEGILVRFSAAKLHTL